MRLRLMTLGLGTTPLAFRFLASNHGVHHGCMLCGMGSATEVMDTPTLYIAGLAATREAAHLLT